MRKCPNDNKELETKKYKGVTIDECDICKGRFFDRGELTQAKDSTDEDLRFLDFELFDTSEVEASESQKKCPKDDTNMFSVNYGESGVVVNKCHKCKGIWLDHHEFEKIISSLEALVSQFSAQDLSDVASEELAEVLTGPKGVNEEMKDFFAVSKLLEMRYAAEHPFLEKLLDTYYRITPLR